MTGSCYRHPDRATAVRCTRCDRPVCPECMIAASVGHQCPTCVEEARQEFRRSGAGPVAVRPRSAGSLTRTLITVNVAVFVVSLLLGGSLLGAPSQRVLLRLGALQPYLIARGGFWRLVTAMFLHASILHIAFNLYALHLFGTMVESIFGRRRFLVIYLVTGFAASTASYVFGPLTLLGVGASGAIFGVYGALFALHFRHKREVPASILLRVRKNVPPFIAVNILIGMQVPGIDMAAHVGGFLAGTLGGLVALCSSDSTTPAVSAGWRGTTCCGPSPPSTWGGWRPSCWRCRPRPRRPPCRRPRGRASRRSLPRGRDAPSTRRATPPARAARSRDVA